MWNRSKINDRAESNYIAGLWFDDLLQGLCWSRSTAARASKSTTYKAPTFSWASVDGPVIYYERDEGQDAVDSNLLPRCINALSTVDGKNPFVVVKDGWIKVRSCPIDAVYITGRLHYKGGEEPENFDPDVELSHFSFHDNDGTLQSSAARTTPMIALGKEPPLDDDGNRFLSKHNCENEPAWLLYLGSRASETLQNTYSSMLFLVLGRSPRRPAMFWEIRAFCDIPCFCFCNARGLARDSHHHIVSSPTSLSELKPRYYYFWLLIHDRLWEPRRICWDG